MDYTIKEETIQIIGIKKDMHVMSSLNEVPLFWKEFNSQIKLQYEDIIQLHQIGTLALSINDEQDMDLLHYYIGGIYQGGEIPDGFELISYPQQTWAYFPCVGPYPTALQQLNYQIYSEWFSQHEEYDIAFDASIECFTPGDTQSKDYQTTLMLPLKKVS